MLTSAQAPQSASPPVSTLVAQPFPPPVPASRAASLHASAAQVLGALPQPMLVIDADRRVLFHNASAEGLLRDRRADLRGGRLQQLGQLDAAHLEPPLRLAVAGSASYVGLWFAPQLGTGWLHIAPVPADLALQAGWPQDAALLVIHIDQPALTQAARIDALSRQCRLSQAERHVLLLLADGEPVEAASRHLGLCVSTVRTHVRSLLGKTQAPTLMQLLRWTGSAQALPH